MSCLLSLASETILRVDCSISYIAFASHHHGAAVFMPSQLQQYEDLLNHKEMEKEQLLQSYRDLSSHNSSLESRATDATLETSNTLTQLQFALSVICHVV